MATPSNPARTEVTRGTEGGVADVVLRPLDHPRYGALRRLLSPARCLREACWVASRQPLPS